MIVRTNGRGVRARSGRLGSEARNFAHHAIVFEFVDGCETVRSRFVARYLSAHMIHALDQAQQIGPADDP